MADIGKFILRVLKKEKQSLRWLARESGVSNSYLSQVTRGLFKASPEVLTKLAPYLGVEPRRMFEEAGWLKPKASKKGRSAKK